MAHLTESPSDKERFMCIYPAYINSKRTLAEGRRIASEKAVENPTCAEIRDVLTAAGMNVHVENKMYPREWNRDVQFRGRVRVQVKKEDGSLYLDKFSSQGKMKIDRRVDIPVYDLSLIRGLWETRVKKYKQRQKKEKERLSQSALTKVNQQWQYRIACRKMKSSEMVELQHYLERSSLREVDIEPYLDTGSGADAGLEVEEKRFIFELCGDEWTEVPPALYEMTYLREWHIRSTKILKIPEFIEMFQDLRVLDMPKNCIEKLPVEIGKLVNLRELNVSYNRLCEIPPELGDCENLEVMELTSNLNLNELPFELRSLKKLVHLDIAENKFASIPVCVLRMSGLQWLDLSNNLLTDLPEDIDRLEELNSLFVHKNKMTYLPMALSNMAALKMVVVSGDELVCYPSRLSDDPDIKFIKLFDNPVGQRDKGNTKDVASEKGHPVDGDKEFMQTYIDSLKGRDSAPTYTTKVSLTCLL